MPNKGKEPAAVEANGKMNFQFNLDVAQEVIRLVLERFPYGGINKVTVRDQLDPKIRDEQLTRLMMLRKLKEGGDDWVQMIRSDKNLKGANCGEMAAIAVSFAIMILQKVAPSTSVDLVSLSNHQMIAIGRKRDSSPENPSTWGENSIICDPWAGISYPAIQFFDKQRTDRIPFYGVGEQVCDDYLVGVPRVTPLR